jgi:hypothetical protein
MQRKGKTGEIYLTKASTEVSSHLKENHEEIFGMTTTRPGGELELESIRKAVERNAIWEDLTPEERRANLN